MTTNLKYYTSVAYRFRTLAYRDRVGQRINKQLLSNSIVLVKKKNGELMVCGDYRGVNKKSS